MEVQEWPREDNVAVETREEENSQLMSWKKRG